MDKSENPPEPSWKKRRDWKNRYAKLYGNKYLTKPKDEDEEEDSWRRISFMTNENTPYTALLMRVRANRRDTSTASPSPKFLTSILSQQSDLYGSYTGTGSMLSQNLSQASYDINKSSFDYGRHVSEDLGGHETLLLDMVRARSRELQDEALDQPLDLKNDDNFSDDNTSEACIHGMSVRMTERSVSRSRSRVSRMSTRRDMDIPAILAFTTSTVPPAHLAIPAFTNVAAPQREEIPRWSIRRAVCPVCSQKWRDKSSISNIKSSGLKRNSSSELPSVIAPARLRTALTIGYVPRPAVAAIDQETGLANGGLRNSSATWQLTRARRFRTPKPQLPPPEATAPPKAAAPLAQRDLDLRVSRFLADMEVKQLA